MTATFLLKLLRSGLFRSLFTSFGLRSRLESAARGEPAAGLACVILLYLYSRVVFKHADTVLGSVAVTSRVL